MKWFTAWAFIIALTGCTTLRPIDRNPVTKIEAGLIAGSNESVPLDQVMSLEM
jgi:hypothetical protein